MQQINCLNLCEILPYLRNNKSMEQIIEEAMSLADYTSCERIYIGTSFCGKYFIHQSDYEMMELFKLCRDKQIKITLVIPTFSEGDLAAGKDKIDHIIALGTDMIDEITVNDIGMIPYISKNYKTALNIGRLFMKDYRDPRYETYFHIPWKPKMFTDYLCRLIHEYKINSCEFDITHAQMDFSDIPKEIIPGIHAPYCYQTVGRICEYASIFKDISKKYRANDNCDESCREKLIRYILPEESLEYLRYGRTIYFKHPGYELTGLETYRLIYFPIDLN